MLQAAHPHVRHGRLWCGLNKESWVPASTGSALLWAGMFCLLSSRVVLSCWSRAPNPRGYSPSWCRDEVPRKTDQYLGMLLPSALLPACVDALWLFAAPRRARLPRQSPGHSAGGTPDPEPGALGQPRSRLASPLLAGLGQMDMRFEGAPRWVGGKQAALASPRSPGSDWLSKSPRAENTALTPARVPGGPRGAASTDVFALGLHRRRHQHPPLRRLPWESSPQTGPGSLPEAASESACVDLCLCVLYI